MASKDRSKADSLTRRLEEAPYSFDFFQAVRRIECTRPDLSRVGHSQRPREDPIRFCQEASLAFAPSAVVGYRAGSGGRPPRLFVSFLGLLGPNGPMPLHITECVRDRIRHHGDETLARFLDVFHHRTLSLFYRAWACNQQAVSYDRRGDDRFAGYTGSLFGIGMSSFRGRDAVPDLAKLHYSGRLVSGTGHAEGLRAILSDYFGIAAEVDEFVGEWIDLPPDCCCRLGASPETGLVGSTTIVGSRIWQCQHKFRVKLGPMGLSDYERMLPGGDSLQRLIAWIRNYGGDELSWDVQLILKAEEVPQLRLGQTGRLGWTTWLSSKALEEDADDLVLRPFAA
jgi:type VI secretion system protein ImpH